ncbi:hypothetical protein F-liban_124 [Faustovirus]|nr:hypothetical protein PRJ_Fausto_00127 [Faustovirus]QBR99041.1 hypothetical protein [Faustovirus mariensis]AMN83073.1 hypothetical protein E24_00141 [Faustovirus]AMN84056.1 hypothetical protein D5a_00140 [Faustovirus]AMN85042.1 hypothetical protein E23_00140 [Faustovirus]
MADDKRSDSFLRHFQSRSQQTKIGKRPAPTPRGMETYDHAERFDPLQGDNHLSYYYAAAGTPTNTQTPRRTMYETMSWKDY